MPTQGHVKLAAAVVLLVLLTHAAPLSAQDSKPELYAAWEANWAPVDALEVTYEHVNQSTAGKLPEGLISRVQYVYRWSRASGEYYSKMTRPNGVGEETSFAPPVAEARRYNSGRNYGWLRHTQQ